MSCRIITSTVNTALIYLYFLVLSSISSHSYASETKAVSELTDTCDFVDGSDEACKRDDSLFDESKGTEDKSTNVKIEKYQKQQAQKLTFEDGHELCSYWASEGECDTNSNYMLKVCRMSCDLQEEENTFGETQKLEGKDADKIRQNIKEVTEYMRVEVSLKAEYDIVRKDCINRHELCAFWAVIGECESNRSYMVLQCAPSCKTCHLIDIKNRCPINPSINDAKGPGEIHDMFENIVSGKFRQYTPVTERRPTHSFDSSQNNLGHQLNPWIVTLDTFLTMEECDEMIRMGHETGYERSSDVGKLKSDGTFDKNVNDGRTSENAWCTGDCQSSNTTQSIETRIQQVTGIPTENYEHLQILKYEAGQYYKTYHDFIPHHVNRQCGPRILTFFIYLSDVEEGGGTNFPRLDPPLTIDPKKGRAVIWSNVDNFNPGKINTKVDHGALPVVVGTKFAANAWIHSKDFKSPLRDGCV